ncbi:MAG: GTPase HflX [Candidatus Pacebacteria bacterium]|nr:GTPase HflX [Candidatus Paceibacterota bacterium]
MPIQKENRPKTLILSLIDRTRKLRTQQASLKEAELLVDTYGGGVWRVMTQNADHRSARTFIGSGKVKEVKQLVEEEDIEIVVVNSHLKASQLFALTNIISPQNSCKIWDRTQLILQIFKNHAVTAEAKLQIRLAELNHHGPELAGLGISLSQQAGGIGTRGIGETNTEIMRRHWQKEIKVVKEKLGKILRNRHQQMKYRKQSGIPTISIIGYTNAGKTTLFNSLGRKKNKVKNALFATLDSSVSSLYLPKIGREIFVSDTIGFIQDLPTRLIEAFKSTLLETANADILLHIIDSSDKNIYLKIKTVNQILEDINLKSKEQIYVFNKVDKLSKIKKEELSEKYRYRKHIFISAKNGQGINRLIEIIEAQLLNKGLKPAPHLRYLENR